jgi:hypothetical protein
VLKVLSLGAGIQSSVVLLMSLRGELPRLDHAIFADTGWEPQAVYDTVLFLGNQCAEYGVPLHVVSCGRRIQDDAVVSQVRGKAVDGQRWSSMPLHTLQPAGLFLDEEGNTLKMPERKGMVRRQCTRDYKIDPIRRKVRELLGVAKGRRVPRDERVEQWFGIGADETRRMRTPDEWWITNRYPLVQDCNPPLGRAGCYQWLEKHYPEHTFTRSACIGCPFRSNAEWRAIKQNATEWDDVCRVDDAIRKCRGMRGETFLHRSCKPLRDAPLDEDQGELWGEECLGYCGV